MGYIRKALREGYLEHPGSACCTNNIFDIFVRFGWCVCAACCLFLSKSNYHVYRQLPCLHTNSRNVLNVLLLPLMKPRKHLVRKRARSVGARWMRVTRHPDKLTKKPRTAGPQQPACSHKEHRILSTIEATAFVA